jgi:hypothetical protein
MREPVYRRRFDAAALLRDHPPQFYHQHKLSLFEIAYPPGTSPAGTIEVTRWAKHLPQTVSLPENLTAEIRPDFYDYEPLAGAGEFAEWHVNFADPRLFIAYGSGLFAQDEMQVAEHPLLGSVREALVVEGLAAVTSDETGGTPILVSNVERRVAVATHADAAAGRPMGIYGNRFDAVPFDVVRRATRRIEPPAYSHIIAMAAPTGYGEYAEGDVEYIFTTAYTAFSAARQESAAGNPNRKTAIHTGFWGCGAFGGNRRLMTALQSLAARAAGIDRLIFHAGDPSGAAEASRGLEVGENVAHRCGLSCSPAAIVGRCMMLGYRWGVSDGN